MTQDIAPHTCGPVFRRKKPENRDRLLHYEYNRVVLIKSGEGSVIPTLGELGAEGDFSAQAEYLLPIDGRAYCYVMDMKVPEFGRFYIEPLTVFRNSEPLHQAFVGITGSQLYRWIQNKRFCGGCGVETGPSLKKRTLVCPSYGQTEYPKIGPTIIVAITNGDKLLMSHYARGAYRNYALIAEFMEIGETFEGCVRRGVMGKVGLRVKNIRYYKSQPQVFSDTKMVGFTTKLGGGDTIYLEEEELYEADWFARDEIVEYGPYISVGHGVIKTFKGGEI